MCGGLPLRHKRFATRNGTIIKSEVHSGRCFAETSRALCVRTFRRSVRHQRRFGLRNHHFKKSQFLRGRCFVKSSGAPCVGRVLRPACR